MNTVETSTLFQKIPLDSLHTGFLKKWLMVKRDENYFLEALEGALGRTSFNPLGALVSYHFNLAQLKK